MPTPATVLIVDDERRITEALHEILESQGYRVLSTINPDHAPALLAQGPIDLLLTDVMMPQMPGLKVAALVQERWPGCRVIFMSGYTSEDLSTRGIPANAMVINKPLSIPALIEAVRTALEPPTVQA